jgi:hypothetical protein
MNDERRVPWREVTPVPDVNGTLAPLLKTVDSLRGAWEEWLKDATPEERGEAQQRRLRRHAIETGIIERLYDLDWGVTEALAAEGLSSDVANRVGGVGDDTLRLIRSQYDALHYLTDLVGSGRSGLSLIVAYLEDQQKDLRDSLRMLDPHSRLTLFEGKPPEENAHWWKWQLREAAQSLDFHANLAEGSWWAHLRMDLLGARLRFLVAVQRVGPGESGMLAVTVYAEMVYPDAVPAEPGSDETSIVSEPEPALELAPTDSVTFFYTDETSIVSEPEPALELAPTDSVTLAYTDHAQERWPEIEDLIRRTLRAATGRFVERLG